ncbi:MAG: iron-containing alcohol dehydrogenase [Candidatus Omnitrophota bacterium]|nr:iron-containing alcohol dehydrogenase [Candidatus Omnitrophota bacterium]
MDLPKETFLPQKIIFGKDSASRIPGESLEFGERGLIVHGRSLEKNGMKEKILGGFSPSAKIGAFCRSGGEPTLDEISRVIEKARALEAGWIAGIGGGSVLDLAKASAGLFKAGEKPSFYQEGGLLEEKGIPFIAVPTTCGTGSEATINSVIINSEKKVKLSIRDESFLARKVILDAGLLEGIPPRVMSYAAMDAFVQAYESFISKNASWFSESFALKAMGLIDRNIQEAYDSGAEEKLSPLLLGSFFAGIALASSRLGVIHGIAHPLGALYGLPHGLLCSLCFIPSVKLNREAMGKKYDIMSEVLGKDLLERIEELLASFEISTPFREKEFAEKEKIIEQTLTSGSTAANPKKVERKDVEFLLEEMTDEG